MDEPSKPPSAGAFLDLESDFSPTIGVRGFDADTLKHLNAIMRAYYNTLLIRAGAEWPARRARQGAEAAIVKRRWAPRLPAAPTTTTRREGGWNSLSDLRF
jgi:hypothetical protein